MNSGADVHEQIVLALRRFRTQVNARDRAVAAAAHLKESDLSVLDVLHREGPQTPTTLARKTSTHIATMTGVLSRLEKEGWIERRATAGDRRSVQVHATSVERFTDLYAHSVGRLQAVIATWSDSQAQLVLEAMTGLAQALEDENEDASCGR